MLEQESTLSDVQLPTEARFSTDLRTSEVRTSEVRTSEVRASEIRTSEVRTPTDALPLHDVDALQLLRRLREDVEVGFQRLECELLRRGGGSTIWSRDGLSVMSQSVRDAAGLGEEKRTDEQSKQDEASLQLVKRPEKRRKHMDNKPRSASSHSHWNRALARNSKHNNFLAKFKQNLGFRRRREPLVKESSPLRAITKRVEYHAVRAVVLVLDAILVGWELESASRNAMKGLSVHDELGFIVCTDIFCVYLVADLLLQFVLEYPRCDLLYGRTGYRWFNILAMLQQVLQVVGHHAFKDQRFQSPFRIVVSQSSVLRVMRLLVVVPAMGLMRRQQHVGDLRVMIRSLTGALPPLLWCSATLFVILLIFGIFFSEGTLVYLVNHGYEPDAQEEAPPTAQELRLLRKNFGTLYNSWLSLYKAIFGGIDWGDLYESLAPLPDFVKLCFGFFISFTFVALMNVVTAVFIKCAFVRSENDRDFMIQKELDAKRDFLDTMRQIFAELDEDDNGKIGFEELEDHLKDPGVGAYFSKLGVDANEVEKLFLLLDEDGSGTIDKEEFMFGCLRLKGEAKSLDLAILHQEVRCSSERLRDLTNFMYSRMAPKSPGAEDKKMSIRQGVFPEEVKCMLRSSL